MRVGGVMVSDIGCKPGDPGSSPQNIDLKVNKIQLPLFARIYNK